MRILLLLAFLCTSPLLAQDVVVSKYHNGGNQQSALGDTVELTVIRDLLNMQNYMLRDFAINTTTNTFTTEFSSGSGLFRFTSHPLWKTLRAGTVLVLPFSAMEPQISGSTFGDTLIMIGLNNPTYFVQDGGAFNIATSDMVMLKRPGQPVTGTEGSVHALSAGLTIKDVSGITPLVRTSDEAGNARPYAVPDNMAGNLTDYNTNRAGTVEKATFGAANTLANQRFLDSLRRSRPMITSVSKESPVLYRVTVAAAPTPNDCIVNFSMGVADTVIISVIDMLGNSQQLYHFYHGAGEQSVRVSLVNLAQGAYFLAIKTNNAEWREKISLVR